MKIFSVPITIYATAYIKADNADMAYSKAREFSNCDIEIMGDSRDLFCGLAFDNPCLPDRSLSPAITIADAESFDIADVEEVAPPPPLDWNVRRG
ncbi:hypothetical protein ABE527_14215 [Brucella sp. TWI432]